MCICWFYHITLKMIKKYYCSSCEVPDFLSYVNGIWNFSTSFGRFTHFKFHKNPSHRRQNILCGQTDKYDAIRNFANAPRDHSFPQTFRLKCFHTLVINMLATCNANHQEKNYANFFFLVFWLKLK